MFPPQFGNRGEHWMQSIVSWTSQENAGESEIVGCSTQHVDMQRSGLAVVSFSRMLQTPVFTSRTSWERDRV